MESINYIKSCFNQTNWGTLQASHVWLPKGTWVGLDWRGWYLGIGVQYLGDHSSLGFSFQSDRTAGKTLSLIKRSGTPKSSLFSCSSMLNWNPQRFRFLIVFFGLLPEWKTGLGKQKRDLHGKVRTWKDWQIESSSDFALHFSPSLQLLLSVLCNEWFYTPHRYTRSQKAQNAYHRNAYNAPYWELFRGCKCANILNAG